MGLFQNLLETYERCSATVGISQIDADGNVDEKKTLLPIFHTTFKSEICITIDKFGKFIGAARSRKVKTIIIPCTESSAGRSNGISAHPLCDQLDYISGVNGEITNAYLSLLNSWKNNNAELNAIYSYISGKTILNDLLSSEIFKESEFLDKKDEDTQAQLDNEKTRKIGVSFAVYSDGKTVNVWESRDLRDAWIRHISTGLNLEDEYFDYLSGRAVSNIASQHPKNINSFTGNAKLISCNDTSGFTFRGRFAKQDDAVIVDYVSSQKVHQMLRWLIASYGYAVDSQVIVTWAVDDDTKVKVQPQEDSYEIFSNMQTIKTDTGVLSSVRAQIYVNYAEMQK